MHCIAAHCLEDTMTLCVGSHLAVLLSNLSGVKHKEISHSYASYDSIASMSRRAASTDAAVSTSGQHAPAIDTDAR